MAAKQTSSVKITDTLIPKLDQWIVPADPSDPRSYQIFSPWKLTLEKDGNFKLKHNGASSPIQSKKLEVVFLTVIKETECRCTRKNDDSNTLVCSSHDRVISKSGYMCRTECPYEEKGVPADQKKYSRPLRGTAVLLCRKAESDGPFMLARYNASLNNVQSLLSLKDTFRQQLVANGVAKPFPSNHSAIISCTTESVQNGKAVVGRVSRDVEYANALDEGAVELVAALNEGILKWYADLFSRMSDRNRETREKRLAGGASQQPEVPAQVQEKTQAPAVPRQEIPEPVPSNEPEDLGPAIIEGEDDDIPW